VTEFEQIAPLIKKHEAFKSKAYLCTKKKVTIGWGHNIQDNPLTKDQVELIAKRQPLVKKYPPYILIEGITLEEADYIFISDYKNAEADAILFVGVDHWANLNTARRAVIIDMSFCLGATKLQGFGGLQKALREKRWAGAGMHIRGSLFFTQVRSRGPRLVSMMEKGEMLF
jgi:lysozyme